MVGFFVHTRVCSSTVNATAHTSFVLRIPFVCPPHCADATSGACETCTVAYCSACSDSTTCDVCTESRFLNAGGACEERLCNATTLAQTLSAGQTVVAVPPGELAPVTGYGGMVAYLDTVKVVCADGYTNGTDVTQVSKEAWHSNRVAPACTRRALGEMDRQSAPRRSNALMQQS